MGKKGFPILVLILGLIVSGCWGQASELPTPNRSHSTIPLPEGQTGKEGRDTILKSVITQIRDTSLAYDWFHFYDAAGRCVKVLRSEQLESKHPIYKLDFPNSIPRGREYFDYFKPLENVNYETGELTPLVNRAEKIKKLHSLIEYGLTVKSPEKATGIIGNPDKVYTDWLGQVTQPACRYLSRIENATIIDALAAAQYDDFLANSLLDCAYITIYNHLGEIYKEVLVPDKLVRVALVSDNGRYLVCEYYNVISDDTSGGFPVTGYLIVDLETNKIDYMSRPEFRQAESYEPLFSDGYFQITLNNPDIGYVCNRLFIDPFSRSFYIKTYPPDMTRSRKVVRGKSFMLYEGMKEDITQFTKFSY